MAFSRPHIQKMAFTRPQYNIEPIPKMAKISTPSYKMAKIGKRHGQPLVKNEFFTLIQNGLNLTPLQKRQNISSPYKKMAFSEINDGKMAFSRPHI